MSQQRLAAVEKDVEAVALQQAELHERVSGLEQAVYLALAMAFDEAHSAQERFENVAALVNPPNETNATRKAFERMVKSIRQYQKTVRLIENEGSN